MITVKRAAVTLLLAGLAALWWWPGYDYVSKPGTYRVDIGYVICVLAAFTLHAKAFWDYNGMVRFARSTEDEATILYAYNQRFRYAVRMFESSWVFGIAVIGFVSVRHPEILTHPGYAKFILTYFFGSVLLTGWLTLRDLLVVRKMRALFGIAA